MLKVSVLGFAGPGGCPSRGPWRRLSRRAPPEAGTATCPRAKQRRGAMEDKGPERGAPHHWATLCHCPSPRTRLPGRHVSDTLEAFVGMSGTIVARTEEQIAKAGAQLGTLPSTFRKPHSSHALLQQGSQRPSGLAVKPILKTTLCYRGGPAPACQPALPGCCPRSPSVQSTENPSVRHT